MSPRLTLATILLSLVMAGPPALAQDCGGGGDGGATAAGPSGPDRTECTRQPRGGLWLGWRHAQVESCETIPAPLLSQAVEQAACRCASTLDGVGIFGDLSVMRHDTVMDRLDPDQVQRFSAAYLSQSPDQALALLAPDLEAAPPFVRALALTTVAQITLRAGPTTQGGTARVDGLLSQALEAAQMDVSDTARLRADIRYLRAYQALRRGALPQARAAIDQALADDPHFFNARYLSLVTALREQTRAGQGDCAPPLRRVFVELTGLLLLAPCPAHAKFMDESLAANPALVHGAPLSLVRMALALVAEAPQAAQTHEAALLDQIQSPLFPTACQGLVLHELKGLRARFEAVQ